MPAETRECSVTGSILSPILLCHLHQTYPRNTTPAGTTNRKLT